MQSIAKHDSGWRQATDPLNSELRARWEAIALPGGEHTENALSEFLRGPWRTSRVLNCAIPLARAKALSDFSLPEGLTIQQCIEASVSENFPECQRDWEYTPQIRAEPQLPQMTAIPSEHASLSKVPWFQSASESAWLGINARQVRYHYQFWQDLKPQVLQGVVTTSILGLPQIGFALTPHIQLEKSFLFLASLGRGLCPVQLFPAKYLYPHTKLGEWGDAPAPIFADILPVTGGFAYPVVDCEPDPWRVLARFGNGDRFYGYPFRKVTDSSDDFSLQDHERGPMLLPNGSRVTARHSESQIYATLDPDLETVLELDREGFEDVTCLVRGACTHDGLPFQLSVEMQPMVFAIALTHWRMELDKPGDLTSYAVYTEHAAIRGFNYFQRVEPYYTNFMRLIQKLSRDPDFRTYPLAQHFAKAFLFFGRQPRNVF